MNDFNLSGKYTWLVWCLPILAFLCLGWADTWEDIKARAGKVTSVKADFVQQKHLPILEKPLISKGEFCYQAPGSLRWEYQGPVRSILLMHNGRVKRFVESAAGFSQESGAHLDAMQVVLEEITQWLAGRFDENPLFKAHLEPRRQILLTPREDAFGAVIQRIELKLSEEPGIIYSVLIYESQDSYTELIFNNTILNPAFDPAVFQAGP